MRARKSFTRAAAVVVNQGSILIRGTSACFLLPIMRISSCGNEYDLSTFDSITGVVSFRFRWGERFFGGHPHCRLRRQRRLRKRCLARRSLPCATATNASAKGLRCYRNQCRPERRHLSGCAREHWQRGKSGCSSSSIRSERRETQHSCLDDSTKHGRGGVQVERTRRRRGGGRLSGCGFIPRRIGARRSLRYVGRSAGIAILSSGGPAFQRGRPASHGLANFTGRGTSARFKALTTSQRVKQRAQLRRQGIENRGQCANLDILNLEEGLSSMARSVRVEFPGAFYHVMARGNRHNPSSTAKEDVSRFAH
jgi:hypothetical protein